MADNFFDLDNAPNVFTVGAEIPIGTTIRGLDGADRIDGSGNPDLILGNIGADTISGLQGADTIHGGRGADLLFGNEGADLLMGERGNDIIFSGKGDDMLMGGQGDDFLSGDAGTDTLTGDDGSDAFVLDIRHTTSDRNLADLITDFSNDDGDVFALTDGANDALSEADITLETVGSDTFISLKANGEFLARVQGVSAEDLTETFSTVRATRDDTEPGARNLGLIPGRVSIQGEVGDRDFMDLFQFQVTETSIVDFSLTGLSADVELLLYQDLDEDGELGGEEIITSSERSDNAHEGIENVTLDPGQYFIAVEQFEGDTSYILSLAGVAGTVARDLAGDRPSSARNLEADGAVELHDYVGGSDPVDTYRLEVFAGGYIDFFTAYQEADLNLTLWRDRNGNDQLDADEVIAQGTNEIELDIIASGIYHVNVTTLGAATPYEIRSITSPGSRVGIESYSSLFPGIPTTGTLNQNDAFDPEDPYNYADPYLLPELGAGFTVSITQESSDFDAYLRVMDLITGEVVAENDDIDFEGGNYNAQVSFTPEQGGQYVVYATSIDSPGIGEYTLNTTVTAPGTQTVLRSASVGSSVELEGTTDSSVGATRTLNLASDSEGPPPVYENKPLIYKPLNGGQINSKLISGVNQGGFGNCFFLAALTATYGKIAADLSNANDLQSAAIQNIITDNGNNYTITFYNNQGQANNITVDNQVVTDGNSLYGVKWNPIDGAPVSQALGQPIWASIFERAYAKWRGGYDRINGGDPGTALLQITGKAPNYINWDPNSPGPQYQLIPSPTLDEETGIYSFNPTTVKNLNPNEIFETIKTTLDSGGYVAAGTLGGDDEKPLYDGVLYQGHAYSVHNAYVNAQNQQVILLRNPHGVDNGANKIAPEDPNKNINDGFITISFEAFLNNFDSMRLFTAALPSN
ncbi:C2 family cysteine protease [Laspinema sp. D1]|uniref:C2 family cysteine protease n=1 Tax=Laspinema palackyanum TaxID=3231601 RepID=UPI003492ED52|nr:C2 family cysteine protease [Laspinema sp. D2b]